jgi:hypothetical protein
VVPFEADAERRRRRGLSWNLRLEAARPHAGGHAGSNPRPPGRARRRATEQDVHLGARHEPSGDGDRR